MFRRFRGCKHFWACICETICDEKSPGGGGGGGGGADPNSLIYSNTVKYYHMNIICSLSSRIRAGFGANIYENDIEESG